ncbi:MAG: protein-S-isoprenylcysteine O-methyltransferase Ste14 [Planctomycetota bacterium]|jgi:protein-S-isoprenylcysteine O-methyltransferase Ste14
MNKTTQGPTGILSAFVISFGVISYLVFLVTFLYQIGFVSNLWVPKGIDDGTASTVSRALGINLALLSLFAIQHTIMARNRFKAAWVKIVPSAIERSIFVLVTSLLLLLINWLWVPLPDSVWNVGGTAAIVLNGVCALGWILVLLSTFLICHFDLFGLRQVWFFFRGKEYTDVPFKEGNVYSWVRHPIMLGFIIAFWAAPHMTEGRLLFAAVTTLYILFGVRLEEMTLQASLDDHYQDYRRRVSMIIPWPPKEK